jgi:hypothetical protein
VSTEKKVLTIVRSKWRRGGNNNTHLGVTRLLNDRGRMCCLGFDAIACGLSPAIIKGLGEPCEIGQADVPREYLESPRFGEEGGRYYQTKAITVAIEHNDEEHISDTEREVLIRQDLKALGWDDVLFVD